MPDAGLDAAILLGCTLCGAGLFALGWLVGHLDREGEYWRGRRDGYERCEAEMREQAGARAVLRRLVGGVMVNEGTGEGVGWRRRSGNQFRHRTAQNC